MTAPTVVLFDLDDTLFAHREAVARGIAAHIASLGGPYGALDTASVVSFWHDLEETHYHSYLAGRLDFEGQRQARARDFAARHGVALDDWEASVWFATYFERYVEAWTLHEDALDCLDALSRRLPGVRFGLITNGDLAFQTRKIVAVGLDSRLEHVIASGEVGAVKPDPTIFRHACGAFGVRPDEAVYVGDRLRTDAIGAASAGLTGVWLNRTGLAPDPVDALDAATVGVHTLTSLAELPPLLAP
ncbi:HAD family hydrolase [Leifsonia poae]|uniref:HAD family hydrolase n=1 Tax=Leifsonia poae TaxID=110933 RepID=UPI001CC12404|nr:HAD family hydrolase [Leifsonia poae]